MLCSEENRAVHCMTMASSGSSRVHECSSGGLPCSHGREFARGLFHDDRKREEGVRHVHAAGHGHIALQGS